MDFRKVRIKIIPYHTILITGLSLVREINILSWVCKTGKVYVLHVRHSFPFVGYIFLMLDFFIFYSLNIFVFMQLIFQPLKFHPVLIIQPNCCLHVIVEFHPEMKMEVLPGPKIFLIIGTLLLNCTLKMYGYRYKFIKNLTFLFMS